MATNVGREPSTLAIFKLKSLALMSLRAGQY